MTQADALPHPSFETIWSSLRSFRAPTDALDPRGAWVQEYRMGAPVFRGDRFAFAQTGRLTLERRPARDEGFSLLVSTQERLESSVTTKAAEIRAAADELGTPRSWTLQTTITDPQDAPIVETRSEGEGRPGATSNWSLFEAVQRLAPVPDPVRFTLMEDLELDRGPQRIVPAGEVELRLASGTLRLRGLRQVGAAHTPWHYWLDEHGRLLFVLSALRTFALSA